MLGSVTTVAPEIWGQTDASIPGHVTEIPRILRSSETVAPILRSSETVPPMCVTHTVHTVPYECDRKGMCMQI